MGYLKAWVGAKWHNKKQIGCDGQEDGSLSRHSCCSLTGLMLLPKVVDLSGVCGSGRLREVLGKQKPTYRLLLPSRVLIFRTLSSASDCHWNRRALGLTIKRPQAWTFLNHGNKFFTVRKVGK